MNRPISIRAMLLTVFLLLMLFPLIVITYITYEKQNGIFQKQVSQYLLQTVSQTQRALEADLKEIDRLTWPLLYQRPLDFLDTPINTPYLLQEANQKFKELMYSDLLRGRLDHVRAVYLVTPNRTVLSTDNAFQSYEQLDLENFNHIVEQIRQQPLKMSWFSDKRAIYRAKDGFKTPVRDSVTAARQLIDSNTSELRGYLFIQLNDRFIDESLAPVRIGSTGALMLSDAAGDDIYRQQSALFDEPGIEGLVKSLPHSAEGVDKFAGKWLTAHETSVVSGWSMTAVVPLNELMSPNQKILKYLLVMAGLGAVIFTIVSVLMATAISKPVINLAKLMSSPSIDQLQVWEIQGSVQEIGVLQRNFNRLMQRIQQLIQENEQQEKEKREALLQALQMQIKPHFLYNTLDTIYWMSKKHKAEPISKLVTALGKFFRFTLNAEQEWTTLQMELEHIANYLQIQSFRYRDRLHYEIVADPDTKNTRIMPLLLQPIVENALEHGISKAGGGGQVTIRAFKKGECVNIVIYNTGRKIDTERVRLQLQESSNEHLGLRNVQQRISLAFGQDYGIRLEEGETEGTAVTVCIPHNEWH
ncbi:Histidine kinase-, DNA gyrase B-, and HSP90-like ATPase [Paenibacillus sp. UNCCL117]|uniref:sensor histidine kinase n=1 Tax=unclassified Paenibacillus TaxID=185978 RepID=UPI0008879B15|nr:MULTISPECIES: sensor histidine kinase [unclassified Paenibacillus]SDD84526.1 histidine kinase [Paenibacillus sp. cl123]SFW54590.1 Histidine kinase-, DNA gyrase B-, and HSP90-like ATPase [Paenibacillus sp. UNCCL117]